MHEIPLQYQEAVDTYEPIDFEGITLFPIKVREHMLFNNARPAIDFLQQSLPVRFLSMPLLSAFYAMDVENYNEGKTSDGLFPRALLFLALSLQYRPDLKMEDRVTELAKGIYTSGEDQSVLKAIEFEQDGEVKRITPVQFQRMRPIIAAQNGIELISNDANPELVEADRDIAEMSGPELDYNFHSLISTISVLSGVTEKEIYDWPILRMNRARDAYSRILTFLVYGFASATGTKFKGGNPVPSPFFDRVSQESNALIDMGKFTSGQNVSISESGPPSGTPPNQS